MPDGKTQLFQLEMHQFKKNQIKIFQFYYKFKTKSTFIIIFLFYRHFYFYFTIKFFWIKTHQKRFKFFFCEFWPNVNFEIASILSF